MQTSELFLKFVRRIILAFFILLSWVVVSRAQNAGNVGIYTREINVFTSQNTTKSSTIFPDFGFAANYLTYCNTAFTGTIDMEWSPNPATTPYIVLVQASYAAPAPDSNCHTLQTGGYFPNLRSTVSVLAGSLSAWYTASAAPIPLVSSGIGSNGPSSPINCDHNAVSTVSSAATINLGSITPINTGDTIVLCAFTISFVAAPSTGGVLITWATATNCSTTTSSSWAADTTSNTPQLFTVLIQQRTSSPSFPIPCFSNTAGVTAVVSASYASVHGL